MKPVKLFSAFLGYSLLAFAQPSHAVPIAQGTLGVNCGAGTGQGDSQHPTSTSTVSCSYTGGSMSAQASATGIFSTQPSYMGTASSSGYASRFEIYANAGGSIGYFVDIVQLAPTPIGLATVPILFSAAGGVTINGGAYSGGSDGSTYVWLTSPFPSDPGSLLPSGQFSVSLSGVGTAAFNDSVSLDLRLPPPDEYYKVLINAGCEARTTVVQPPASDPIAAASSCSAYVDSSVIALDQAALDALLGPSSFTLTDYYRIDLSSNLVAAPPPPPPGMPEPGSLSLLAIGLAMLTRIRRVST